MVTADLAGARGRIGATPAATSPRALALPGTAVRWGFTVVAGGAGIVRLREPELRVGDTVLPASCRWVLAWEQRDSVNPARTGSDRRQRVRELLVRDATVPLPRPGEPAPSGLLAPDPPAIALEPGDVAPFLVKVVVPDAAPAGTAEGTLVVEGQDARWTVRLRVDVLPPLPEGGRDPVALFYRGRLASPGEVGAWPEVVSEAELRRDVALLRELGITHVSYYGGIDTAPRAREILRDAGFRSEVVQVGWPAPPPGAFTAEQVRRGVAGVRAALQGSAADGLPPPVFWVGDEPVGPEIAVVGRRALVAAGAGGLTTAALRAEAARQLAGVVDVPMLDNDASPRREFLAAARECRDAGVEPWQYWQCWVESGRFVRWNAGFRQPGEPTRGQAPYCFAHATGSPWDDFDGGFKDMLLVHPQADGQLVTNVQFEALQAGLEDLRIVRSAREWVRARRDAGADGPAVRAVERATAREIERWRWERNRDWGTFVGSDVAAPARRRGPPAAALEDSRERILAALRRAVVQDRR